MSASGDDEQVEAAQERAEHRGVGAERREQALAEDRAHELALHLLRVGIVVGLGCLAAGLEEQAVRLGALGAVLHDRRLVPGLDLARRRRLEGEVERVVERGVLGDRVGEQLGVHHAEAAAPAVERVGARVGVADGDHPEGGRAAVDDEATDAVAQLRHRVHLGDRPRSRPARATARSAAGRRPPRRSAPATESARSVASSFGVARVTEKVPLSPWNTANFR